jgi:anti-sigma factor RsiW
MKDVTCAQGVDLLMDYVEGLLPAAMRSTLETHVAGCPRCVAFTASYTETPRIVRDATAVELPSETKDVMVALVRTLFGPSSHG